MKDAANCRMHCELQNAVTTFSHGRHGVTEGGREGGREGERERERERERESESESEERVTAREWMALKRVADTQSQLQNWCASEKEGVGISGEACGARPCETAPSADLGTHAEHVSRAPAQKCPNRVDVHGICAKMPKQSR